MTDNVFSTEGKFAKPLKQQFHECKYVLTLGLF